MAKTATKKNGSKATHRTVTGEQKRKELDQKRAAAREPSDADEALPPGDGWEENGGAFAELKGFVRISEDVQVHAILRGVVEREKYPFLVIELLTPMNVEDRDQGTVAAEAGDMVGISYASCLKRVVDKGIGIEFWVLFGEKVVTNSGNEAWSLAKSFARGTGVPHKSRPAPAAAPAARRETAPAATGTEDDIPF